MSQSKLYSRLRLNPVPESILSPDVPVPPKNRPAQMDDPVAARRSKSGGGGAAREMAASWKGSRQHELMTASMHAQIRHNDNNNQSSPQNGYTSSDVENNPNQRRSSKTKRNREGNRTSATSQEQQNSEKTHATNNNKDYPRSIGRPNTVPTGSRLPNKKVSELKRGVSNNKFHPRSTISANDDDSSPSESDMDTVGNTGNRRNMSGKSAKSSLMSKSAAGPLPCKETKKNKYAPEKYSSPERGRARKTSAPNAGLMSKSMTVSAATGGASVLSSTAASSSRPSSAPMSARSNRQGRVPNKNRRQRPSGTNGTSTNSVPRSTHAAATVIQKAFRGHSDNPNDSKVDELKAEVRELRSEEHIKYLTKELSSAKSALEQERKLRALQMDAIKVLWKEVQMMDATKGGREADKSRPSGSIGSKISSRSSEHSIAKLMETLEATVVSKPDPILEQREEKSEGIKRNDQGLAENSYSEVNVENTEAVERLSLTCNSLQTQVEQLQSSLKGVITFMSSFNKNSAERIRHSSETNEATDFLCRSTSDSGPASLPPAMFMTMPQSSITSDPNRTPVQQESFSSPVPNLWQRTQATCDSLVQTEISIIPTPQQEGHPDGAMAIRPSTLPGLNREPDKLATLAGRVVLDSPKASTEVKAYARSLVQGILSDSIGETASAAATCAEETSTGRQDVMTFRPGTASPNTVTDVSLSSQLETDSLDEYSPKKFNQPK